MRRILLAIIMLGVIAAACASEATQTKGPNPSPTGTRFEVAFETVGVTSTALTVEDEGTSIVGNGPADSAYNKTDEFISDLAAILLALDVPTYVIDQMDSTTSLMGLREATWDGIEASWSYHPDNGLDIVLIDTKA
jgi:hypothetical protein